MRCVGLAHAAALLKDEREDLGSGDVADAGVGVVVELEAAVVGRAVSVCRRGVLQRELHLQL